MQFAFAHSLTRPSYLSGGPAPIVAPFDQVNGPLDDPFVADIAGSFEGWSVVASTPPAAFAQFSVDQEGYDTSGTVTTHRDTFYVTQQLYQPYPNQTTLSSGNYALSDYIYSTSTIYGGAVNNSALISPKPVANWATLARGVVGNAISTDADPIEVVAFHRNARSKSEVACVIFHFTDGTTTINVTVSAMTESVVATDRNSVLVYRCPQTDITSLNAGVITVNASVYPWVGAAASVRHSSDSAVAREFSPRYYQKNTTLAAAPWYVCVDNAGNDTLGAVSTVQATAEATPCLTIQGALKRATAVLGATTGVDGVDIVCNDGTHILTSTGANQTQKIGRVTVRRSSTSASRAACIIQGGAAAITFQLGSGGTLTSPITTGCIRFKDVRLQRNGNQPFISGNTVNVEVQIEDCDIDFNGTGGANTFLGANSSIYVNGWTAVSALPGAQLGATANGEWRLFRGVDIDMDTRNLEMWLVIGSAVEDMNALANLSTSRTATGAIAAFNDFRKMAGNTTWTFTQAAASTVDGLVNSYNLYEWTTVTSGHSFCMSNDSAVYNNKHVIEHHNTYIGWGVRGRRNMFYDEGATARLSQLHSCFGNVIVGDYTKGDVFVTDGSRLGNWAYKYGVACFFECAQYRGNEAVGAGAPESQVYPGMGTVLGTTWNIASQTIPIDFRFTNPQGVTGAASPGAGDGTYTLLSNSPVKNVVTSPIRPITLDGVTVGTTDNAGAYSAA